MAKHLTEKAISKIHALHASGLSGLAIAKKLKRSPPTIYKALSKVPGAVDKPKSAAAHTGDMSSIEAMVDSLVKERIATAIKRAIAVLSEAEA